MKEKRIMIRLSAKNAQWLNSWRTEIEYPVSLTFLANRALTKAIELGADLKTNNKRK